MPKYTLRPCRDDKGKVVPDDYEFMVDGVKSGRLYLMLAARNELVWRWTVYGISSGGMEIDQQEALRMFKATYEAAASRRDSTKPK